MATTKKIEIAMRMHVTVGDKGSYNKEEYYVGLGAEPADGENHSDVANNLFNDARALLETQFGISRGKVGNSAAEKVIEAKQEQLVTKATASDVPMVTARNSTSSTDRSLSNIFNATPIRSLSVGPLKGKTIVATVEGVKTSEVNGSTRYAGKLRDTSGTINYSFFADGGSKLPFNDGDEVKIENAYKVSEYKGSLAVELGKFVTVVVL